MLFVEPKWQRLLGRSSRRWKSYFSSVKVHAIDAFWSGYTAVTSGDIVNKTSFYRESFDKSALVHGVTYV